MPRVQSTMKQKNKPFKGKSKKGNKNNKSLKKIASTKTKPIMKQLLAKKANPGSKKKSKKQSKIEAVEQITTKNQYLDEATKNIVSKIMKQQNEVKVVLLLPCNEYADTTSLLQSISLYANEQGLKTIDKMSSMQSFDALEVTPHSSKCFIRNKLLFISPKRDIEQLMDLAKCADIICPILSCKLTNTQRIDIDPHQQAKAFDEFGYTVLNMIRNIGLPSLIGVIQHLEHHEPKNRDKITRLFKRFLGSEFGEQQKVLSTNQSSYINKLLRTADSIALNTLAWKRQRGYMLIQEISVLQNGLLAFSGHLKGNSIHANQLVHLTGFDDYEIERIEIKVEQKQKTSQMETEEPLQQFSTVSDSMQPFSKPEKADEELMTALEGLKFNADQKDKEKEKGKQVNMDSEEEDIENSGYLSDEEEESEDIDQLNNAEEIAHQKKIELQLRKQDELEFEDEVEYAAEEEVRQKFRGYQGLKNFKTSEWNHLQNLPEEYDRIFSFKNYHQTMKNVQKQNESHAFAYPGFYVTIVIKGIGKDLQKLQSHVLKYPIIMSFLLNHERKMTIMHAKVRRNPYYPQNDSSVQSNNNFLISLGFRRVIVKPIFSRMINGSQKTKYIKKIGEDYQSYFYCSFYYYNLYPPSPVLIYRLNQLNHSQMQPRAIMYGQILRSDPLHIILQRIILSGYPFKINRRRAVIRFMFFNPKDVKYFKPIELRTKHGLRGKIEQSVGLHGNMKCFFNDPIKHHDTVCMFLYQRKYPQPSFGV